MEDEEHKRPKPEALLEIARKEESAKSRGRLTIYLGLAPGVGKTYFMLSDARLRKKEGRDVVVGYVEPHGRVETESLLEGLEIIPLHTLDYKGIKLEEMDIDAILERKPEIVLVDELAHTNSPGSRHAKRYQDVEEIINAGINVYTTLNVQHLESLNDTILLIQGIRVRETVPDTILEAADEIKLVDLPPEELIKRLKEGKIYVKDMAESAVKHFFQPGNLQALREIALRLVADRVDEKMRDYMKAYAIAGPWPAKERILACIYASPYAEQLVRSAYHISSELDAELIALYVETEKHASLSEKELEWLTQSLDTAKKLGGTVTWIKGEDIVEEISRYATNHNVTKICIGKPTVFSFFPSLAQKIMARTEGIDIFLFAGRGKEPPPKKKNLTVNFSGYMISALAVGIISLIGFFLRDTLGEANVILLMLLPVIVIALLLGRGASIFAAVMSILIFDYAFVPPYFSFKIGDWIYFVSFIAYLAVVLVISSLASSLRFKVKQLRESEARSTALYELSRDLVASANLDQLLSVLISHTKQITPCEIAIFLPANSRLEMKAATPKFPLDANELTVADWVWGNGKPAGAGTSTLAEANAYYMPLATGDKINGVMGCYFDDPKHVLTQDNQVVLDTIARLGALAIEKVER